MIKTPHQLAKQTKDSFMQVFGDLYEHSAWIVEQSYLRVKDDDTYNDLKQFHAILQQIVLSATTQKQDKLITSHPTLAGKKAQNNELTTFSTDEQKSAGLSDCTDAEIQMFEQLNKEYYQKFCFPFILAVKNKNKQQIVSNFKSRLSNTKTQERQTALIEINNIAWIRIKAIYDK